MQSLNRRSAVTGLTGFESGRAKAFAALAAGALAGSLATFACAEEAPGAATPPPGESRIEVLHTAASWDNLAELFFGNTPAEAFSEGSVFVLRGEIRNRGEKAVHHVVLRYELLDDDGHVLQYADGFNRSAESMRPDEEGVVRVEDVQPIPAGGVDTYRMVFFHDEVPKFTKQQVRILEVHDDAPSVPAAAPGAGKP